MYTWLHDLEISNEEIRSLNLEYLATTPSGKLNDLHRSIADLAVARGFHAGPTADPVASRNGGQAPPGYMLSSRDFARACDVMWDLIIEGIVRPGSSNSDQGLPF